MSDAVLQITETEGSDGSRDVDKKHQHQRIHRREPHHFSGIHRRERDHDGNARLIEKASERKPGKISEASKAFERAANFSKALTGERPETIRGL